jgi:hypothetical protein
MEQETIQPPDQLLCWLSFFVGTLVGWQFVEWWWQRTNPYVCGNPQKGAVYSLMTFVCAVSTGVLCLALAGWRYLPTSDAPSQNDPDQTPLQ